MRTARFIALTLLALSAPSCLAGTRPVGDGPDPRSGRVVRVLDGDTVEVTLDDGGSRRVRLLGVDAPELDRDDPTAAALGRRAADHLRSLVGERRVTLERDTVGDTVDAYGRWLRHLRLDDGTWINLQMVEDGYARALTRFPLADAAAFRRDGARLRAAERRGLWADDGPVPRLAPDEAAGRVGRRAVVCGRVASARHLQRASGEPTFLNLGRPYPDQPFAALIWGDDRPLFDRPERRLLDRRICVTGRIERYRGRPRIVLRDPAQLSVAD